jgi:hypothetical protein
MFNGPDAALWAAVTVFTLVGFQVVGVIWLLFFMPLKRRRRP